MLGTSPPKKKNRGHQVAATIEVLALDTPRKQNKRKKTWGEFDDEGLLWTGGVTRSLVGFWRLVVGCGSPHVRSSVTFGNQIIPKKCSSPSNGFTQKPVGWYKKLPPRERRLHPLKPPLPWPSAGSEITRVFGRLLSKTREASPKSTTLIFFDSLDQYIEGPYFSKIYRSGVVYNKKSPDSPALSQFQLSAIPAIPMVIPGPAASASAALQGGAAAARGPEILPDRSTFVAPRGAQAEDAPAKRGTKGKVVGRCRLSVVVVFFGGGGGGSVGWGWVFLFSGNLMEKKQA